MDEESGMIHLLNATGTLVWACLDGMGSVEEIARDVAEVLGLPPDQVTHDVLQLVRALKEADLLDDVGSAGGGHHQTGSA